MWTISSQHHASYTDEATRQWHSRGEGGLFGAVRLLVHRDNLPRPCVKGLDGTCSAGDRPRRGTCVLCVLGKTVWQADGDVHGQGPASANRVIADPTAERVQMDRSGMGRIKQTPGETSQSKREDDNSYSADIDSRFASHTRRRIIIAHTHSLWNTSLRSDVRDVDPRGQRGPTKVVTAKAVRYSCPTSSPHSILGRGAARPW
ncbi:hypothetical protein EJ04DRAFT_526476 [Polyplosphaeria fusca]|uniref:Uncharacterized protein n=1 Tax=Polyplosphaeria fusca TaxID=682080 RepID=A0A9P4QR97_9PLEO|nr:hypothetical protein EJ04DRAFT_526476 [Polyplosphaeria fusca]